MLTAVKQHASAIPYSYGNEKERCSSLEIAEARLGKDHPSVAATLTNLGSVLSDARTQWINTFWEANIDEALHFQRCDRFYEIINENLELAAWGMGS